MKFKISAKQFLKYVTPIEDIATKNIIKSDYGKGKDYPLAKKVSVEATPDQLILNSNGGTASIVTHVKRCDGYIYEEQGGITIHAKELVSALKSFSSHNDLSVSIEENCLKIALESDKDIYISLAGTPETVPLPKFSSQYQQQVIVDKEFFIKGLEKVAFAQAFEEKMYAYMCILFEVLENEMRFSAGSGGRFAIVQYVGDLKKIASGEMRIIIPKFNINNITRIFKKASCSTIKITFYESDQTMQAPTQITLQSDNMTVSIYGLEHFTNYPDLTRVINYCYPYQVSSKLRDWDGLTSAIKASICSHGRNIHNTKVVAKLKDGYFDIHTKTTMRMNLRVVFSPDVFVAPSEKSKNHKPWFACNSDYLREMIVKGKSNIVILNFEDQEMLKTIPDDKPKQIRPVLLKFPEKMDKNEVNEKYYIFFTVSNR